MRGSRVEIRTSDADRALRDLLERSPQAHGIEVGGADLEEAFVLLTQKAVRVAEQNGWL